MLIREHTQLIEKQTLSEYAALSENSKGRITPIEECDIRTCFQRDRDRIIHSNSFRRLKHKTQVFLSPEATITGHALPILLRFRRLQGLFQGL